MPKFVALIYGSEAVWEQSEAEYAENMRGHEEFGRKHGDVLVGGAELQRPATARTIRGRGDTVTDGPFLETKEVLGGYYVIDAPDLDAAVEIAKDIPEATVEVRPIVAH